jgi:SAF domain
MAALAGSKVTAGGHGAGPVPARPRRRNGPLAVAGVLVVAVCSAVFAAGWLQAGHREPVLAVARPVAAGQVLSAADLVVVRVSAAGPVTLLPASQEPAVAGRTAAVSLPAGSLLTSGDIGPAGPAAGQAVMGVALKPGQYPPDLAAGQTVDVLATPAASTGTGGSPSGPGSAGGAALPVGRAVVLAVDQASSAGVTVAELEVSQDAMPQVAAAAAAGQVSLAAMPAGG